MLAWSLNHLLVRSAVGIPVAVHASLLAISEVGEAVTTE